MRKISDKLAITFGLLIFSAIFVCGWYFYRYTKYYLDRSDYYKSGYAPVLVDGKVIAIVGVDASAAFLQILKRFRRNVLTFGLACILISLTIVYIVSKTITNQIHKLVAAIENISLGDFKTEIKVDTSHKIIYPSL